MNILVTGGAGFIGGNFIHYWLKKYPNDHIINFDNLTYAGNLATLKDIEHSSNYTFVKGDICSESDVDSVMKNIDIIVHFAAESHVDRSITGPMAFIKTNVEGTANLLAYAKKYSIKRFHHISTDEVFGALELGSNEKFNENTKYNPHSPYSASKAGSDHIVRAYYDTYGLPITITNCANNYGPYHFPEKLFPLAITNLLEDKKIPVYGDGNYVRDWLHVEDHCRAIDLVLHNGRVGETYCVGSLTQDITNLEIIKLLLKLMHKNDTYIEYVQDRPGHDRRYAIDFSKIQKELGWEPIYSDIEKGLKNTIEWYKENEWWWKPIKNGEYKKYYEQQYIK